MSQVKKADQSAQASSSQAVNDNVSPSLAKIFNEEASAAYKAFPEELKRLVVLLVPSSDTPVYVSPEVADQLTKSTADIKAAVAYWAKYLHDAGAAGVASRSADLGGVPVAMIALDTENTLGVYTPKFTKDMILIFALDHEIGHHILKYGYPFYGVVSDEFAESAASTYAMLRHIQRFGNDTDHLGEESERTAYTIILRGDTAHYSSDSIERAIQVSQERDISGLSLTQTAALADKIAAEYHLSDATLDKIRIAYLPVKRACEAQIGSGFDISKKLYGQDKDAYTLFCRQTIAVMKQHQNDPDIIKAGERFLNYPPIRNFMVESAKSDASWKEALSFIDNAQANASTPKLAAKKAVARAAVRYSC